MVDGVFNLESVQVNCKRVISDTSCISCAKAMHTLLSVYHDECVGREGVCVCVWWDGGVGVGRSACSSRSLN